MRISINKDELPVESPRDAAPWERDVPEGWRDMTVREAVQDPFKRGDDEKLGVKFVDDETGAYVDLHLNTDDARDQAKLAEVAEACGLDPADLDTDDIGNQRIQVRIKHGKQKDKPPYHWVNAVGFRPLFAAPEAPDASELDGVAF